MTDVVIPDYPKLEHSRNPIADGCPLCGGQMYLRHVGKENWLVCESCRVKDLIGSGLFTNPEPQSSAERGFAARRLVGFRELTDEESLGCTTEALTRHRAQVDEWQQQYSRIRHVLPTDPSVPF